MTQQIFSQEIPPKIKLARPGSTWLLLGLVIFLVALPLLLYPGTEFRGTDNAAGDLIAQMKPGIQPWFEPIWLPGSQMESLLFALQAAIGAGLIGYYLGLKRGAVKQQKNKREEERGA